MKYINNFETIADYESAKLSFPNVSYIEETEKVILVEKLLPKNNQIFYTTTDGNIVRPYQTSSIGTLVSNTYEDGLGVMTFENDITTVGHFALNTCYTLESIVIPSSVTTIGNNAFASCIKLTSIEIPSGVTTIGNNAFIRGWVVSMVSIPSSVTSIGASAFEECEKLTDINYDSTSAQFNSITKGGKWKYIVPTSCIVHCTDGDFPITQFA